VPEMSCPRCALVITVRASFLRVSRCPRCLATARIAVPMFVTGDGHGDGTLAIHATQEAGSLTLELRGELDLASAPALQHRINGAVDQAVDRVLVDLRDLEFIDGTGLQVLLYAQRRLREHGRRLVLRRGPGRIQRLFDLTHTTAVFEFVD
jgi:anti-sigma B factor antagonist